MLKVALKRACINWCKRLGKIYIQIYTINWFYKMNYSLRMNNSVWCENVLYNLRKPLPKDIKIFSRIKKILRGD